MRKPVFGVTVIVAAAFSQLSLAQQEGRFLIPDLPLAAGIALGIPGPRTNGEPNFVSAWACAAARQAYDQGG